MKENFNKIRESVRKVLTKIIKLNNAVNVGLTKIYSKGTQQEIRSQKFELEDKGDIKINRQKEKELKHKDNIRDRH